MFNVLTSGGSTMYDIKEFICESTADLTELPKCAAGSICYCLEDKTYYVKDFSDNWTTVLQ